MISALIILDRRAVNSAIMLQFCSCPCASNHCRRFEDAMRRYALLQYSHSQAMKNFRESVILEIRLRLGQQQWNRDVWCKKPAIMSAQQVRRHTHRTFMQGE